MNDRAATAGPRCAVLVLNHDGREHLEACLGSLGAMDVFVPGRPGEPVDAATPDEVWLVDNGSGDGSLELVRDRFPWVRTLRHDGNLGFSEGYNRAVPVCPARFVVLLNNDTRVAPGFLSELLAVRERRGAVAAAGRILSWDGTTTDFAGADTFFTGHAWQRDLGQAAPPEPPPETRLLFGCAGALLVSREAFLEAGGFDPDYFSFFEDVDLGWRLAMAGGDTWLAPRAVVYHRLHASWDRQGAVWRRVLTERNALCTATKCWGEERAGVLLLLAAALTFLRGWATRGARAAAAEPVLGGDALGYLLGLAEWRRLLPAVLRRRHEAQARRRRSDEELAPLFGALHGPPLLEDAGYRDDFLRATSRACGEAGNLTRTWPLGCNAAAFECAGVLGELAGLATTPWVPADPAVLGVLAPGEDVAVAAAASDVLRATRPHLAAFLRGEVSDASLDTLREGLTRVRGELVEEVGGVPATVTRRRRGHFLRAPVVGSGAAAGLVHGLGGRRGAAGAAPGTTVRLGVVVRTRDRLDTLRRALVSVAAQARPADEVVLVNDGGADPGPVLAGLAPLPVRRVDHPTSLGRTRAAAAGLTAATADFVTFLDDDDELKPNHLEVLGAAVARGARVAYSDVEVLVWEPGPDGAPRVVERGVFTSEFDLARLRFENYIPFMAALVDRRLALEVGGLDTDLEYFEDWDLLLRLAERTDLVHCPEITASYWVCPAQQQGQGLAGAHRFPHMARLFDKHRGALTGADWTAYFARYVEPTRERLLRLERLSAGRVREVDEALRRLEVIEASRSWRLVQRLRRLLGRG